MYLAVQGEAVPRQTLDQVNLPERTVPVQNALVRTGDQVEQIIHPGGLRKCVMEDVMGRVVVLRVNPRGVAQIFGIREFLVEHRPQFVEPAAMPHQFSVIAAGHVWWLIQYHQARHVKRTLRGFQPQKCRVLEAEFFKAFRHHRLPSFRTLVGAYQASPLGSAV